MFYLKEVFILSPSPQAGALLQGQILYAAAPPSSSSFFPTDHEILSKTGPGKKPKKQTFLMDNRYHTADLIRQIRNK